MIRVIYILVIFLLLSLCLIGLFGCTTYRGSYCPVFPLAGVSVADELETSPDMPNFYKWLGDLEKLKQELDYCIDNA